MNTESMMEEKNKEESNDDNDFFGEDIAFSEESVDKRLRKAQKRNKLIKRVAQNKPTKQNKVSKESDKKKNNQNEENTDDEEFKLKVNKKKVRKEDLEITCKEGKKEVETGNHRDSEVITIEDEETEKGVIKLNVKVYKRKESNITVIKTLIVALYTTDPIKKLTTFISKNLNPKTVNLLEDIKVYFDGDHVNKDLQIKDIGIENEEQLEVKVPFECNWNK